MSVPFTVTLYFGAGMGDLVWLLLRLLLFREGLLRSVRLLGLQLLGDLLVHLLRVLDLDLGLRDRRLGLRDLDLYLLQRLILEFRLRAERGLLLGLTLLFLST